MLNCSKCERVFEEYDALRRHVGRVHKINSTSFYVEYYLNGQWPLCKCGCDKKVKWSKLQKKFRDFVQGHQSRIHNNWGHNPKAVQRSSDTRRKQYASGERKVWNDGLDTNDPRVKNNIEKSKHTINNNPLELSRRSSYMRKQWESKNIVPRFGPESPRWNGGTSSVSTLVYSSNRLYKEWKYPILKRDGFACKNCGSTKNLQVHHDKEWLSEIIKNHMEGDVEDFEQKRMIADKVIDYHVNNKVSGITLCLKCHNILHPSLNFKYTHSVTSIDKNKK